MGYALLFARSLQQTAKKNQLTYERIRIQNQQENITKGLSNLQQMEGLMNAARQQEGQETPNVQWLQLQRQMLTMMSNSLDTRLKCIETQLAAISAEEKSSQEALNDQIAASAPKYVG